MKILISQTGFIGDVILSTPVFSNLRNIYPQAKIHLLTTPESSSLFEAHQAIDQVIVFDKRGKHSGWEGFRIIQKQLKGEKYDLAFGLHKSYRSSFLLYLSKIEQRYGFKEAKLNFLYSKTVSRKKYYHEALRNLCILENIDQNIDSLSSDLNLNFSEEILKEAKQYLNSLNPSQKKVVIAPGSVWATKRWHTEGFAQVAKDLSKQGSQIILIGGPNDIALGNQIENSLNAKILNLIGRTKIVTSAAIISLCDLLISNDSSPLHMASACKTPVIALFCATAPEFGFGPWKTKNIVLGVDSLSCRPCSRHGLQYCPTKTHACQNDLLASEVSSAAIKLLNQEDNFHAINII